MQKPKRGQGCAPLTKGFRSTKAMWNYFGTTDRSIAQQTTAATRRADA